MSRERKIQFNVNEKEYERLKSYAELEGLSMAEVLRDYIKTLTPPKGGRTTSHDWSAWALCEVFVSVKAFIRGTPFIYSTYSLGDKSIIGLTKVK